MFYWFYFTILCLINLTQTAESRDRFRPGTRHKVFSFASYYGDHMVLQRGPAQADIWGYITTDNQTVQLQFNGKNYSTYSHPGPIDGVFVWKVKLEATVNPGPYVITATSNGETISLRDVLFGDVWICSGQSNMAFTLSMLKNASAELKITSNYSHVRVFTAAVESSTKPLYDLKSISVPWSPSSPSNNYYNSDIINIEPTVI
ncbi:sialate O-acetylesterase-like [Tubulanus polymorphus]|uniref:sialate O-acetylesterase-like n=1 Tax=Tubulanus polymorphus TaxID=672921 RepID=UPI003DA4BF93